MQDGAWPISDFPINPKQPGHNTFPAPHNTRAGHWHVAGSRPGRWASREGLLDAHLLRIIDMQISPENSQNRARSQQRKPSRVRGHFMCLSSMHTWAASGSLPAANGCGMAVCGAGIGPGGASGAWGTFSCGTGLKIAAVRP